MKRPIERLDTTPEELDALVEQARVALDEAGYQKLKAAIRTLGYVTALLEDQQTTLQSLRNLLCQKTDGENRRCAEAIRHQDGQHTIRGQHSVRAKAES